MKDYILSPAFRLFPVFPYRITQPAASPSIKVVEFACKVCQTKVTQPAPPELISVLQYTLILLVELIFMKSNLKLHTLAYLFNKID